MSIAEVTKRLSAEDIADRPDDGVERDLIRGELRERPMTRRNPDHSEVMVTVGSLLRTWSRSRPSPRGKVSCGEVGFRLRRDPETFVGIDVAYASPELVASRDRKLRFYDGPPALAVEILSPSDRQQDVIEKVGVYLESGAVVWVIDPAFRTVIVHRPGRPVEALGPDGVLSGEPELPGFTVTVADLFE